MPAASSNLSFSYLLILRANLATICTFLHDYTVNAGLTQIRIYSGEFMNNSFVSHYKSFFQAPHSSGSRAVQLNLIWHNICRVKVVNKIAKFPVPFTWKELKEIYRPTAGEHFSPLLKRGPSLSHRRQQLLCTSRNSSSFPLLCTHGLTSFLSPHSLKVVSLMKQISGLK